MKIPENRKTLFFLFPILIFTFLVFFPCLKNGFVNWDDDWYFTNNALIKSVSFHNVKKIFTSFLADRYTYQPLTAFSYLVEYHFFKSDPAGYHLVSLLLHVFNTGLVFWLVYILSKRRFMACVVGILFGMHPVHVESIAWVSARKDILCGFFFLLSLIAYARYLRLNRSAGYYILSLAFFLLALLAKTMAITLPLVLFLLDGLLTPDNKKISFRDKIPFFALSFIFAGIVVFGLFSSGAIPHQAGFDLFEKFFIANFIVLFYLTKILVPVGFSCWYPGMVLSGQPLSFIFLIFLFFIASLGCLFLFLKNRLRHMVFGALFFLATILPVLQFLPTGRALVADRYLYIPSLGIFYLAAEGLFLLCYRKRPGYPDKLIKIFLVLSFVFAVGVLGISTFKRCAVWKNDLTLWKDVLKHDPRSATAYNNLGIFFAQNGGKKEAMVLFKRAIRIDSRHFRAYNNLGMAYSDVGKSKDAVACFKKSIALNPRFVSGYINLCREYTRMGRFDEALAACRLAIKFDPDRAEGYNSLGAVYYGLGETQEAIRLFKKALDLDPSCATALHNLDSLK